ncbi:MAG: hypothetical protein IT383_07100 [Deltaproteobacteria bacterium]|nr:hypothetical protein [Deltaproteobacteria bacterium]
MICSAHLCRPLRRPLRALLLLSALVMGVGGCPGEEQPTAKPSVGTDGRERWVVTLEGEAPDLTEFRSLTRDNPKAVAPYVDKMRQNLLAGRSELEGFLTSVDGRVVERWWMSNAITVEVPASAVASLKKQGGVKQVAPDLTLE